MKKERSNLKKLILILLGISLLLGGTIFIIYKNNKNTKEEVVDIFKEEKEEVKEDKITIEIKAKEKLLITYKYQDKEFNNLSYGDKIKVKGTLITPVKIPIKILSIIKNISIIKIYYLVEATSINKIANNHNYLYTIKNILYQK